MVVSKVKENVGNAKVAGGTLEGADMSIDDDELAISQWISMSSDNKTMS